MNIQLFLSTLPIMAYGLLGIFAVMLVIYVIIRLLSWLGGRRAKAEKNIQ